MIQGYSQGRFEWFVVATVIAIIAIALLSRYLFMAEDVRVLRFELLSHRFMTAAANARTEYLVAGAQSARAPGGKTLLISGRRVYLSSQGWPVSVTAAVNADYRPTLDDCFYLWTLLLQNPAPIVKGSPVADAATATGEHKRGEYRVLAAQNLCRYQLVSGKAQFDYYPLEGRLLFSRNNNGLLNIN